MADQKCIAIDPETKCSCPSGYPKLRSMKSPPDMEMPDGSSKPRTWQIEGLFLLHTGGCPLADELLAVQLPRPFVTLEGGK